LNAAVDDRANCDGRLAWRLPDPVVAFQPFKEIDMHQIIYIVGLIVVVLAILSFFGLR
jgi:hypothetical protein